MVAGEDFGGTAGGVRRINGHDDGEKGLGETFPGDVVLVHVVALGTRWLEDELVFEKESGLAVELGGHVAQQRRAGDAFAHRADVDDGIKAVEAAFSGLGMVLPAAADVVHVDEGRESCEASGFVLKFGGCGGKDTGCRDKAITMIGGDLFWSERHGKNGERTKAADSV